MSAAHAGAERWHDLLTRLELPDAEARYTWLCGRYAEPARHYHTLTHVGACLHALDSVRDSVPDADVVELALWYHDVVYTPGSATNERDSADVARQLALDARRSDLADTLERLIMKTVHPSEPEHEDERWLVDIDLGILGQDEAVFDRFERDIRAEYHFVPEADFRARRRGLLRGFLDTRRIYRTAWFHDRLEARARANLERVIARLGGPAAPPGA